MATIDINVSSQIPNLTRVTLQALISGSDLSTQKWYVITNAVGSTKRIAVMALSASVLSEAAVNLTDGTFGTYDITTDTYTPTAGGSGVASVTGDSVDNTDPANPIVNAIPLAGTASGSPVMGDLELKEGLFFFINYLILGTPYVNALQFNEANLLIDSNNPDFEGAKYNADYSANYTDRSLVDKAFVLANAGGVTDGDKGDVVVSSSGTVWTVEALQTRPVSNTAPTTNQALVWNGSTWIPTSISHSANASPAGTLAAGLTRYIVVQGSNAIATGEGSLQQVVPKALTTISAACYLVITVATVGAATLTLRKNGVDTGLVVTIPNGATTGIFTATGAVSFSATDLWSWEAIGATTNSIQINNIRLDYE